jgi:hypothetical protein
MKKLNKDQEFQILKLVLDKFLWLGFGIMAFGLFQMLTYGDLTAGLQYMIAGAVVLFILLIIIVKEYEVVWGK